MKDTWNVYDWAKSMVNDRFRFISNLLLLFIIFFLGFQNIYGDFNSKVSYMHVRLVYWFLHFLSI